MAAKLPVFPEFVWDEYYWVTSVKLASWGGFQRRESPRQSIADAGKSDGKIKFLFAPDGRGDEPLSDDEIGLVQWVIDHQASVHDSMLNRLFDEYPTMRKAALEWVGRNEVEKIAPALDRPAQLKDLVEVVTIHVHQIEKNGKPFIGVEMECTWDVEHGVGILLHGETPMEIGGADTAFYLWIAKKYLTE